MNPNNLYQPQPPRMNEEPPQECEDRKYWRKRFNFASWLFLFIGFYGIFFSENASAGLLGIGFSVFWRMFDVICDVRHVNWHLKNDGKPHA